MKRIHAVRIELGRLAARRQSEQKRTSRMFIENASNGNQVSIRYTQKFEWHEMDAAFVPSNLCARLN